MRYLPRALGWLPDLPDTRDYTSEGEAVRRMAAYQDGSCSRYSSRAGAVVVATNSVIR